MLCRQHPQEWSADGIRINSVPRRLIRSPTRYIATRMSFSRRPCPLGASGHRRTSRAIVHLAGPDADYVTGINVRLETPVLMGPVPAFR